MSKLLQKHAVSLSILAFLIVYLVLYPYCKYHIDTDGMSYLTIARRVATGDYFNSINGLWSPLSSWMIVPFLKAGMDGVMAYHICNAIISAVILIELNQLGKRFGINTYYRAWMLFSFSLILVSYAYMELAGDLLQLMFMLIYLDIIYSKDFISSHGKIVLVGIVIALAYLSKAFTFCFYLVQFPIVNYVLYKNQTVIKTTTKIFTNILLGFGVFLLVVSPWLWALYLKYGHFTISNAGSYVYHGMLNPGNGTSKLLLAPPYPDSYCYWEDPYIIHPVYGGPLSSWHYFYNWIKSLVINTSITIQSFTEMSFFSIATGFLTVIFLYTRKFNLLQFQKILIGLISCIVITGGYMIIHVETRFIWLSGIMLMFFGIVMLQMFLPLLKFKKIYYVLIILIFFLSYIWYPVISLKYIFNSQKDLYELAAQLRVWNIKGKFASNYSSSSEETICTLPAYLTHSSVYAPTRYDYTEEEMLNALQLEGIQYYWYIVHDPMDKESIMHSRLAGKALKTYKNLYPGLIIFKLF